MKEDEIDDISEKIDDASTGAEAHSTYVVPKDKSKHLSGMFQNWFLDYASYGFQTVLDVGHGAFQNHV